MFDKLFKSKNQDQRKAPDEDQKVEYKLWEVKEDELERHIQLQANNPSKIQMMDWLVNDSRLPETFSVLDIGCGPGTLAAILKDHSVLSERIKYTGLDQSEVALEYAKQRFPDYEFILTDVLNESLPDNNYDVIMIHEVIEHIPDYEKIIEKVFAHKPEVFIISTFAVVASQKEDMRKWREGNRNYMNTYSLGKFYAWLRDRIDGPMRVADFGYKPSIATKWFPKKARILWYCYLEAKEEN